MKADFPALWAESPSTLRREPTPTELAGGFPCGPLDLPLFNELMFRLGQIYREGAYAITQSGQTPNANNTGQLWAAMQRVVPQEAIVHRGTNTGTANALVADISPNLPNPSLDTNALYLIGVSAPNTGPVTANLEGLGNKPVVRSNGNPLQPGDISRIAALSYDGTNFVLLNLAQEIAPPGSAFVGTQQRFAFLPQAGVHSYLTASFTTSFAGTVRVTSLLNSSPSNNNIANGARITVNGTGYAGAADEVAGSNTSIVSTIVKKGDVVTAMSDVISSTTATFTVSQYLIYEFLPG